MFALDLGDGLALHLYERRHAAELFALVDRNRALLERWFPWPDTTRAPEDLHPFIDESLARFARRDGFEGGLRADGRLVGGLGVHHVDREVGTGEIGYWLGQSAQGRGAMTRAVAGLVRYLFEEDGFARIEIRCHPDNVRSRAIPERLGFRQEGTLRRVGLLRGRPFDHVVYGLLEDEWRAARDEARPLRGAESVAEEA
jgi:ribosomal-protein-serine acetyltransferase